MKKKLVLFVLFIVPIVVYLFFATGVHNFTTLPILTRAVPEMGDWKTLSGKPVKLQDKITVLAFGGDSLRSRQGDYFNLNQKIYERYHKFRNLQFVVVCPFGMEPEAKRLLASMDATSDVEDWHFVFAPKEEIATFYKGLRLRGQLDADLGSDNVVLIDKKRNLRGRPMKKEYKESYNMMHASELSNEMLDDFKILLYEYKKAYKSNNVVKKQPRNEK
ncbi:MAG TPA: hypothetical protein VK183_12275 [Flavobacterium sp.]|nr:hypothetical protein [Flavobacterium sp.]